MEDWINIKLKDIGSISGNGVDKTYNHNEKEVKLLNYMDVYSNKYIDSKIDFQIVTSPNAKITKCNVLKDDIFFTPSSEKPYDIGNSALAIENIENLVYSYHITRFRLNNPPFEINSLFLLYQLNSFETLSYFITRATGQTRFTLNKKDFESTPIKIPKSIIEQRYIANTINAVDKTIQATKNSIAKLEKLKTSLMQNLLTGKMKPDGSWRTEDEFWLDDKFGKVPKGWKISYLKDVQDINKESLPASTDPNYTLKYITIEAVFTDRIDFDKVPEYKFSEAPGRARRIIKKGDFIVSTVRPNLKGFARLQEEGDNWICSTGFATVSPIEKQVSNFYFFQILSFIGEKQFASFISGSNYPAVTDRDFKQLKVYEAPFEEQIEIANKIESVVTIINKKQNSINQLDKLKKSLMQNLLTGKVRIPQEALKNESNG